MISIDPDSSHIKAALKIHIEKLRPIVLKKVNALDAGQLKIFLTPNRIEGILSDKPDLLEWHHNRLMEVLDGYSVSGLKNFINTKKTPPKKRSELQKGLVLHYEILVEQINDIFKYTRGFGRKTSPYSTYILAEHLGFQTCVYCNRIYTKTVKNPNKVTRPEFDHWYPKESYPLLALSFYNLIPSCHVCNSSVKGSTVMSINEYLHPYVYQNINMSFSYRLNKYGKYKFQINRISNSKEDRTIKAFRLEEIYRTHEDEIKDLLAIKRLYTVDYILKLKKLLNRVDKNTSIEELYRLAFGTHINEADFHKRPLSKMKKDILKELNII